MADFALGLICGAAIIAIIWWRTTDRRVVVVRDKETSNVTTVSEGVVVRPDNGKARRFADPRYRALMEDRLKKKSPGGVRDAGVS
ncbi:MAG TPA: hypothetical protein PK309_08495 [Bacillota bacterium]|jgi:predicted RNase H-like nuclease|nr:hypothetical protein [Bacillota bacterium]